MARHVVLAAHASVAAILAGKRVYIQISSFLALYLAHAGCVVEPKASGTLETIRIIEAAAAAQRAELAQVRISEGVDALLRATDSLAFIEGAVPVIAGLALEALGLVVQQPACLTVRRTLETLVAHGQKRESSHALVALAVLRASLTALNAAARAVLKRLVVVSPT